MIIWLRNQSRRFGIEPFNEGRDEEALDVLEAEAPEPRPQGLHRAEQPRPGLLELHRVHRRRPDLILRTWHVFKFKHAFKFKRRSNLK